MRCANGPPFSRDFWTRSENISFLAHVGRFCALLPRGGGARSGNVPSRRLQQIHSLFAGRFGSRGRCEQQYSQIYAQCQISASDSYNECEYDNIVFGEGTDAYNYCPGYYDWDLAICESNLENSLESCQEDKVMNDQAGYMLLVVTQNACYATYQ